MRSPTIEQRQLLIRVCFTITDLLHLELGRSHRFEEARHFLDQVLPRTCCCAAVDRWFSSPRRCLGASCDRLLGRFRDTVRGFSEAFRSLLSVFLFSFNHLGRRNLGYRRILHLDGTVLFRTPDTRALKAAVRLRDALP